MEISSEIMFPPMENSLMMRLEGGGGGTEDEQEGHQCYGRTKFVAGKCGRFSYCCGFSKIFSYFVLSIIVFLSALDVTSALRYCHQLSDSGGTEIGGECDVNFCYSVWNVANETGEPIIVKQGCWEPSPPNPCDQEACEAKVKSVDNTTIPINPNRTYFCCCNSDFCNEKVSMIPVMMDDDIMGDHLEDIYQAEMNSGPDFKASITAVSAALIGLIFVLAIFVGVYVAWKNRVEKSRKPNDADDMEAGEKLMEPIGKEICWELTDPIILGEEIAKGKFASVCSGKLGGSEVALKVFAADNREFYENEKFIFQCLGKTVNSHIVKYHGWQEFAVESSQNLILVLDRIRPGNLKDFLVASEVQTLPLAAVMKIMQGVASGLSYLHGENKDEVVIAHRDLASKNILVDEDLNCYISDFGLSLLTRGSKYFWAGRERQAEFCSLAEAGTLRYMAPELLEGAVNLKDCENALKQADVYALALILWEVANLSHDIALPSCCHRLPYEQEIGKDICIESLARYVVSRRDRPSFSGWRDSPVSRSIRDTLNESWDPEPDARLTALCIVERLTELQHSKNIVAADSTTPLEAPQTSPWAGRNPCLQRNLLEENSDEKSMEFLVTSEKHLLPKGPAGNMTAPSSRIIFMAGGNNISSNNNNVSSSSNISSSGDQSFSGAATTNTDLSSSSAATHPLHMPVPPNPIPFVQNIRR